ncbi:hypothetical protein P4H67_03965 [Paenibacillus lautus]|uniref:hypothetical protein n=2 Tax=Paenibacillus TaxID=44249 RepID=UPI002DBFFE23|nr:hypothetical protein [Paenibacillus lautus]MEC0305924.1 hypothetical protein [Paenibacillus lautus]
MKNRFLRTVLIISAMINILGVLVFGNHYITDHNKHAVGDNSSYRTFIHGLKFYSQFLSQLDDDQVKEKNMNLLINADERLHLASRSLIEFKYSMSTTNLNMNGVEIILSSIEESMFNEMSVYLLEDSGTGRFIALQSSVDQLLEKLPQHYNSQSQEQFIGVINNIP